MTASAARSSIVAGTSVTLLCFASGATDVLSYLTLGRIFTSAMTGCMALFVVALVQGKRKAAFRAGISLGSYMVGDAVATMLQRRGKGQIRNLVTLRRLLAAEVVVLATYCLLSAYTPHPPKGDTRLALIGLSAFAMGIQAVVARDVRENGIITVALNITLTSAVVALVRVLLRRDEADSHHTLLQLLVVVGYAVGAVGAAGGLLHHVYLVDLLPFGAVLVTFGLQFLPRARASG